MHTIAQTITQTSPALLAAQKLALEQKTNMLVTNNRMKAVYEFADGSLLVIDMDKQRMITA